MLSKTASEDRCMYTAQGELVCNPSGSLKERFVQEKPNVTPPSAGAGLIGNALKADYCDISVTTDPKTGHVSYSFKKECEKNPNDA